MADQAAAIDGARAIPLRFKHLLAWPTTAAKHGNMTASELEQLLIARLVKEKGGTSQTWQRALGKVIVRDAEAYAHCNWDIRPNGSDAQCAVIERLLDDIRLEHSIVAAG